MSERKPYPSDVNDDEWAFVAPYLTLMTEDAPQREHPLREVFNGLRNIVRGGIPWRMMSNDLPPWHTAYPQSQRWLKAGVFEARVFTILREVLRLAAGRNAQPSAAIFDSRRGNPARRVVIAPGIMGPSGAKAVRPIWRRTRWVICWR
jgi:transposase